MKLETTVAVAAVGVRREAVLFSGKLTLHFNPEMILMLIVLNNRKVIQRDLSDFPRLQGATVEQLNAYELSSTGTHWPVLDEDLSLRGFLKHEMLNVLGGRREVA